MKKTILGLILYVVIVCATYYLGYIPGYETISDNLTLGIFGLTALVFFGWTLVAFYNTISEWIKQR